MKFPDLDIPGGLPWLRQLSVPRALALLLVAVGLALIFGSVAVFAQDSEEPTVPAVMPPAPVAEVPVETPEPTATATSTATSAAVATATSAAVATATSTARATAAATVTATAIATETPVQTPQPTATVASPPPSRTARVAGGSSGASPSPSSNPLITQQAVYAYAITYSINGVSYPISTPILVTQTVSFSATTSPATPTTVTSYKGATCSGSQIYGYLPTIGTYSVKVQTSDGSSTCRSLSVVQPVPAVSFSATLPSTGKKVDYRVSATNVSGAAGPAPEGGIDVFGCSSKTACSASNNLGAVGNVNVSNGQVVTGTTYNAGTWACFYVMYTEYQSRYQNASLVYCGSTASPSPTPAPSVGPNDVTMACSPSSPVSVPRASGKSVGCTLTANANLGSSSITIRAVTLSALPAGWTVTTSPSGTTGGNGVVTISPARTLTAGTSWSFTANISASCSATASASLTIATRVAKKTGTVTGADATGPARTYVIQATTSPATVSTTVVRSSLNWSVPYSFSNQTVSGSVTYGVTGAGCSGWSVAVSTGPFVYSGTFPGTSIPASNLRLTSVSQPALISGGSAGVSSVPTTGELSVPRTVLRAQQGAGNGTYQQDLEVALTVPGGAVVGSYHSTITIDSTSAP